MSYIQYFKDKYRSVQQVDHKQMAIVEDDKGNNLLFSYYTIVGYGRGHVWYLTDKKYSTTTSKQLSKFRQLYTTYTIGHDDFMTNLALFQVTAPKQGWN